MIEPIKVSGKEEGSYRAAAILQDHIDQNTLLFLSGGSSPDLLYQLLANNPDFLPGAVALIDERFGEPGHENSNEQMIREAGLIDHFKENGIAIYLLLQTGKSPQAVAAAYGRTIQDLFKRFKKRVAVMGIGNDGHTAGIAPNRVDFQNSLFGEDAKRSLVGEFDDKSGPFGQRVTLTFKALDKIDTFVVLAFGENKREVLQKLTHGSIEKTSQFPSMFYRTAKGRTLLITDQELL